jgi:putative transposase
MEGKEISVVMTPEKSIRAGHQGWQAAGVGGGGLIRSLGGWSAVKALGGMSERIKGDERILGDGGFVEEVLKICQERLERRYRYQAQGYDFGWEVDRVAEQLHLERDKVTRPGRYPETVEARSVLCYWQRGSWGSVRWSCQNASVFPSRPPANRSNEAKRCW